MTLDFLNATEEHMLSISDSDAHAKTIIDFLEALVNVHIILGAWACDVHRKQLGSPDNDDWFIGTKILIDARPWRANGYK